MPAVYPYTVATGFSPCSVVARSGPFVPTSGTRYLAMQDYATGQICIFKSTDEGQTWAIQDNGSAPSYDETVSAFGLILAIQDDTDIWILVDHAGITGAPSLEVTAYRFDTLTDTWARTDDTGGAFTSDSSTSSGNWSAFGMRIHEGVVEVVGLMKNAATDDNVHPIFMSSTVGGSGWTWDYFPQLDGTNDLQVAVAKLATVRGTDLYTIARFTRATFDISYSCFASGGSPAYSDLNDIRSHKIDDTDMISDFLDGCLAKAATGDLVTDGELLEPAALENVQGDLWHIYANQQFPSGDWSLVVQGPDTGDPAYGAGQTITLTSGHVPDFFAWISRAGTNPILLFTVFDGVDSNVPYVSTYDGVSWSTPVVATGFFPSIANSGAMSFAYTEGGQSGLLQLDQYWEYKFDAGTEINIDSILSTEDVPNPTIILGEAPAPANRSKWYTY